MAFLEFVKAKGICYVYVAEYCGEQKFANRKKANIYRLGNKDEAIFTLQAWYLNFNHFPQELKRKGYNENDLKKWIDDLKMKRNKMIV